MKIYIGKFPRGEIIGYTKKSHFPQVNLTFTLVKLPRVTTGNATDPFYSLNCFILFSLEKETKTLILSTGVLESLQSACDASAVVARLQDNLQVNQAALADPEPETTRMVRCLATIAKNESRLDVVHHLRQITPAGTTGLCLFV